MLGAGFSYEWKYKISLEFSHCLLKYIWKARRHRIGKFIFVLHSEVLVPTFLLQWIFNATKINHKIVFKELQCIVAVNRIQLAMKMVGHIHKFQTIFIVFSLSRVPHFMKFGTSQKQINYFSSEHFVTWNHILFVGTCTNSIKHVPW